MKSKIAVCVIISGLLGALASYVGTVYVFYADGRDLLCTIALFVPPADLILSFVASPVLGVLGVVGSLSFYGGLAILNSFENDGPNL